MSTLKITVSLKSPVPVYTESMPATVTLQNAGAVPVQIPDPDAPSQFEFIVRPLNPASPPLTLSATAARFARDPDPAPPLPADDTELAPGAMHSYSEDIASYAAEPLPPGHYALTAVYGSGPSAVRSAEVPVEIVAPRLAAYAAVTRAHSDVLEAVLANRGADGRIAILQSASQPARPQDRVSYRRVDLPPGASVDAVAVSVEALPEDAVAGGRWYAYLQAGHLGAGMTDGATAFLSIEPVDLGLQQAQLHAVGWQPDPNRAVFMALGVSHAGHPAVAIVTFLARERRAVVRVAPLGSSVLPTRWTAQYGASGGGHIELIAGEAAQAGTRLYRQRFSVQSGPDTAAAPLLQRPEPLAALALPPVGGGGADAVDLLFGPLGAPARMLFVREPVSGGAAIKEMPFVVPSDERQQPPSDWALVPALPEQPVLAARFRGQIIARSLMSGQESVLEQHAPDAAGLQLHALEQEIWATWVDPSRGLQARKLP